MTSLALPAPAVAAMPTPANTGASLAARRGADLVGIQYARALAAMMVVIFHLQPQFLRMGFAPPMWAGLAGGVDVFFVISGVIMWITTRDRDTAPLTFLSRRLARIVPLYWAATSVSVVLMLLVPSVLQTARFDLPHVIASYAFLAWRNPGSGAFEPVVIPGWTLNYEMFFYLVFAALLLVKRAYRLPLAAALFGALALLGSQYGEGLDGRIAFYTSPLLLEFVAGMVLGELHARTGWLTRLGRRGALGAVLGGLALLLAGPDLAPALPRFLQFGLPAAALVAGVLALDTLGAIRDNRLLLLLGNASYSLYLVHPFALSALGQIWRKAHLDALPGGLAFFAGVAVVLSCVLGVLSYRLVERPLGTLFRRRG